MYSVEPIRDRIQELILKHEPHKIESLNMLMKHYRGKEDDLHQRLCKQYEEECLKSAKTFKFELPVISMDTRCEPRRDKEEPKMEVT